VQLGREFSAAHATLGARAGLATVARDARFCRASRSWRSAATRRPRPYAGLAAEQPSAAVLNNQAWPRSVTRAGQPASRPAAPRVDRAPDSSTLPSTSAGPAAGRRPGAAEFFLRGRCGDPLEGHVRVVLTWALRKAGRTEDADKEWKGVALARNYAPLDTPTRAGARRILSSERMRPEDRAERTDAEVAAGLVGRAERRLAANDADGALRELGRAAYLDPYAQRVHLLLARAYRAKGDRERAESELRMTLWSQEDPRVRAELARLLKEMGRASEARKEAEKVLRIDPSNEIAKGVIGEK
jgi:tetratricopeptide (TPR) repeat protein